MSGCEDRMLKVWHYDEGLPMGLGYGHGSSIKAVKISPDEQTIVSVGTTGEIFWEMPKLGDMRELRPRPKEVRGSRREREGGTISRT